MAKGLNLKAVFSADTSGLKKGSKEATESIKAFENESSGALTALGKALGINLDKLQRMSKAGEGAEIALRKAFHGAEEGAVALTGKLGLVAGGIGALAVGFAIASWKELNAQADYFYQNSLEGARSLAAHTAYVDTLTAAIREANDVEGAAARTQDITKGWEKNKAFIKSLWLQIVQGTGDYSSIESVLSQRLRKAGQDVEEAAAKATTASGIASMIKLAEEELDRMRGNELAKLKKDYEQERLLARETSLSIEDRMQHQAKAEELLAERIRQEGVMLDYIIDLKNQYNEITMTSAEAQRAVNQLMKERENVEASHYSQQRELVEYNKTLTNEYKKQNAELEKRVALATSQAVSADLDAINFEIALPFDELTAESSEFFAQLNSDIQGFKDSVKMDVLDVEAARAIDAAKSVATQINNSFKGIINNAVSGFSDLIGGAIAGTTNFGEGLLALFGDLLTQLGQIAIAAGVGMLGIKKAFETLNPWVAIGAGVALVALGSAISNSVTALSNNIGSVGSGYSVGSGGQSYASTLNRAPSSEPMEVTGRFEIRGDDLVAVIGRNNKRKTYVG